ncbi:MAG: STAS domain-containing protein [Betaproteobacteria bacterium]|nr:STAS domain-containing protein [Betaproteobacteria bacterium]
MTHIIVQNGTWHLSGEILVDNANTILVESTALSMSAKLCVDLAAVTSVDTSALSLLMEWQRRAASFNQEIAFANLPDSLTSLAALYGVTDFIALH